MQYGLLLVLCTTDLCMESTDKNKQNLILINKNNKNESK